MARLSMPLAAFIAAGLAGCSTYDPYYSSTPVPAQPVITAVPAAPATTVTAAPARQVVVAPAANAPVTTAPVLAAPASGAVPSPATYRMGMGTVESVALVRVAPPSASAGASAPGHAAYRLSVRMDDGTVQSIDQDNRGFMVGDRVQVTNAGSIVRR